MKLRHAAIPLFLLVSGTAAAQPAPRDIRCMLVTTHYSKTVKDPKLAPLMSLASSFYLGRIDQGVPAADLDRLMRAEAKTLVGTNPSNTAKECVSYMMGRVQTVQRIGQNLAQTMK